MKNTPYLFSSLLAFLAIIALPLKVESRPFVYAANGGSNTVSVIDAHTNSVVASIPVGNSPRGITAAPDGRRVYVANYVDGTVSIISVRTQSVVGLLTGFDLPLNLAVTPDGTQLYVTNSGNGTVAVIDTATNHTQTLNLGGQPNGVAVAPDGSRVYVGNSSTGSVAVISVTNNSLVTTIQVSGYPTTLAVSPDSAHVYVADGGPVAVIDTATNTVEPGIDAFDTFWPTGVPNLGAVWIAFTPDGSSVYITTSGECGFSFAAHVATANKNADAILAQPTALDFIAITATGTRAYIASHGNQNQTDHVLVLDIETNTFVASVQVGPIGGGLRGLAISR
jgi:YVTN family beta-propeller protein